MVCVNCENVINEIIVFQIFLYVCMCVCVLVDVVENIAGCESKERNDLISILSDELRFDLSMF